MLRLKEFKNHLEDELARDTHDIFKAFLVVALDGGILVRAHKGECSFPDPKGAVTSQLQSSGTGAITSKQAANPEAKFQAQNTLGSEKLYLAKNCKPGAIGSKACRVPTLSKTANNEKDSFCSIRGSDLFEEEQVVTSIIVSMFADFEIFAKSFDSLILKTENLTVAIGGIQSEIVALIIVADKDAEEGLIKRKFQAVHDKLVPVFKDFF